MNARRKLVLSAAILGSVALGLYACGSTETLTVYVDGGTTTVFGDAGTTTVFVDGGVQIVTLPFDGGQLVDAGPSSCGDAAISSEPLGAGMYGCAGSVRYEDRGTLCGSGATPCSGLSYLARLHPSKAPTHNYWTSEGQGTVVGTSNACRVGGGGKTCAITGGGTPMRVCKATQPDTEGNQCNWTGCGLESNTNEYFGGCSGNTTAGTLCCPNAAPASSGCASNSNSDTFNNGMAGCAGKVLWSARESLCAANYHVCSATEWNANRGASAPTHNYWTEDLLRYSGSNGACSVSKTTGNDCAGFTSVSLAPAHVCSTKQDSEGNQCAVTGCGAEIAEPSRYLGSSCEPDASVPAGDPDGGFWHAGTICCSQ